MIARSQKGIVKPKPKYALSSLKYSVTIPHEPHNIWFILAHPSRKAAMEEELGALQKNQTWELIPRTTSMHLISSEWVLKPKIKLDGSLDCLKARVVPNGYITKLIDWNYLHGYNYKISSEMVYMSS